MLRDIIELKKLGKLGEDSACKFLKGKGCKIIERNFKSRFGEIDIIAEDNDVLCFIEVKTRKGSRIEDSGLLALNKKKIDRIIKTAKYYLYRKKLFERKCRFDLIVIEGRQKKFEIELMENIIYTDKY